MDFNQMTEEANKPLESKSVDEWMRLARTIRTSEHPKRLNLVAHIQSSLVEDGKKLTDEEFMTKLVGRPY